jgi:YggT family protein
MLILLNILYWFARVLDALVTLYMVVLFARVIISWIRVPYNQIVHLIYQVTEPVLRPIRRRMPMSLGLDLSPMIVFLALLAIRIIVIQSLYQYVAIWQNRYYLNQFGG